MRLGWRVPLPGPFSVSGSIGGRRRGGGHGCLPWLGLVLAVGFADLHPWLWIVAGVVGLAWCVLAVVRWRQRRR